MKKSHLIILSLAATLTLGLTTVCADGAADRDASKLIGPKMCGICHKKDATGNQLGKWEASPHAKAFETLGTPAAKEAAAKLGIDDPQTSGKCLKCHSTAYNFTEEVQNAKIKVEEGVSCESCHGPGKDYKSKSVMEDQAKSIAAGLVHPPTKSCKLCHNEESPTFKGFNEDEYVAKIAHPNPEKQK